MIVPVTEANLAHAAGVRALAWQDSHRTICSAEFVAAHTPAQQADFLRRELAAGKRHWLCVADRPVGVVTVAGSVIEGLYVRPDAQHQGYGSALLRHAMAECAGAPTLWVLNTNTGAAALYTRHGFVPTGQTKPLSPGLWEVEMRAPVNTPTLETERLILRRFTADDIDALFAIYGDEAANTYLPWFPLRTREEAEALYARYAASYAEPGSYRYAICHRADNLPIGYVHISPGDAHDLGYALRHEFWHQGIVTEAARAVVMQARRDGLPYLTATHDVNNPRSGGVMRQLGMRYQYTYEEQWQPKDFPVHFRLYQLNLDGRDDRVYRAYWDQSAVRWVEDLPCPGEGDRT